MLSCGNSQLVVHCEIAGECDTHAKQRRKDEISCRSTPFEDHKYKWEK